MVVITGRSRGCNASADKYDSQALHADAPPLSTDIWSSAVVILIGPVLAGRRYSQPWLAKGRIPSLRLCVACIVVYVSWRLAGKH